MLTKQELALLKETYKVKAYYISFNNYLHEYSYGEIVFAKSEKEAKKKALELYIGNYCVEDVNKVERKPYFDKYSKHGYVSFKELYLDNWQFYCAECELEISLDNEDQYFSEVEEWNELCEQNKEGLNPPPLNYNPQFEDRHRVFCSLDCQHTWHDKRIKLTELKTTLQQELQSKYPECTIKYVSGNYNDQIVRFDLIVPGLQYKVTYESDRPNILSLCESDINAWNKYKLSKSNNNKC